MPRRYAIVIERATDGSFSAYVPDLPGCVGRGAGVAEAVRPPYSRGHRRPYRWNDRGWPANPRADHLGRLRNGGCG